MENSRIDEIFGEAMFDVEHALGMYATESFTLSAERIYDKEKLDQYKSTIESCHIYIIGFTPAIKFVKAEQEDRTLIATYSVQENEYALEWPLPLEAELKFDGRYYLSNESGERFWPRELDVLLKLKKQSDSMNFDVKYIGQAYGKDGSRSALDRLLKHEKLQKISLKGVPEGYQLSVMLFQIHPNAQVFTIFNPFAQEKDEDGKRIRAGIDKLYDTSEKERITLFEAALTNKYFYPEYNKEFKNSFPSTNLKVLEDCYDKDFSAVIAEICIDDLPYRLFSDSQKVSDYHIAKHDLHDDDARKVFFKGA